MSTQPPSRVVLDWTKPIYVSGDSVPAAERYRGEVLAQDQGNVLVCWRTHEDNHAFVTEDGKLIATLHNGVPRAGAGVIQFVWGDR